MAVIREVVTRFKYQADTQPIRKAERSMTGLSLAIEGVTSPRTALAGFFGRMGTSVGLTGAAIAGVGAAIAGTAYGLGKLGKSALKSAIDMEQNEVAFETMLKSREKSLKLIEELQMFARETPFEQNTLIQSAKQLLAFGTTAENMIPTLSKLGDIAAGVGLDRMHSIVRAYGRMQVKGRVTMEELNLLLEAGVPILHELAKGMGVTEEALYKMVERGKVRFSDIQKAINSLSTGNGTFAGLMIRQSKTLGGILSNLGDYFEILGTQIGQSVLPEVKALALAVLEFFNQNEKWIKTESTKGIKLFVKMVEGLTQGFSFLIKMVKPVMEYLGGFADIIQRVWQFSIIGRIVNLGLALIHLSDRLGEVKTNLSGVGETFEMLGKAIGGIFTAIAVYRTWPLLILEDLVVWAAGGKSLIGTLFSKGLPLLGQLMDNPKKALAKFFDWFGQKTDAAFAKIFKLVNFEWTPLSNFSKDLKANEKKTKDTGEFATKPGREHFERLKFWFDLINSMTGMNIGPTPAPGAGGPAYKPSMPLLDKTSAASQLGNPMTPEETAGNSGLSAVFNNTFNIDANGLSGSDAKNLIGDEVEKRQRTDLKNWGDMSRRKITA